MPVYKTVRTRLTRKEAVTIFLAKRGPKSNKTTSLLVTEIIFLARRSKYHLSIWPLSRGELMSRLDDCFFKCPSFYYRSCHVHLPPPPPFWTFRLFFLTRVEGYFLLCQGLLLRPVFSNSVHSFDESVFSTNSSVDFFTPIARFPQVYFFFNSRVFIKE